MMKNYSIVLFVLIFFSAMCYGQKLPKQAPFNPEFVKYLKLRKEGKIKKGGYIPSPANFDYSLAKKVYKPKQTRGSLPSKYDLRDENLVSPAKDQGEFGTCWAFGTTGAVESYWMKIGIGQKDLSEKHMATCHRFEYAYDEGGFFEMTTAYYTRHQGPVVELDDPYYTLKSKPECKAGTTPAAFIDEARFLPGDKELLKQIIMNYGAVATTMASGSVAQNDYYNDEDYTFYFDGSLPVDHAVLIVGWDDSKKVTGGGRSPKGNNRGAWIVKNSWGRSFGDKGFFYVSYKDSRFLSDNAIFPSYREYNEEENVHMYDDLGAISSYRGEDNTAYGLTKFEVEDKQFVHKIGTWIMSAGTKVDIEIYDDLDMTDTTETNFRAGKYDFVCDFPGYYTFDIPCAVEDEFYVKVKYHSPGYDYPLPVELVAQGYGVPEIEEPGINWRSVDGKDWMPLGKGTDDEIDLCIRAYTIPYEEPVAFFTANKEQVCVGSEVVFTDESQGEIDTYTWDFGEGGEPQTITVSEPFIPQSVVYSTPGEKEITLTVSKGSISNTQTRKVTVVDGNLNIFATPEKANVSLGKSTYLYVFGDADEFMWSPDKDLDSTVGATVLSTPTGLGSYTYLVTGTQGTCTGTAVVSFMVNEAPANDDVVNAIQLKYGKNGPFTNEFATVESNEPYPDTTTTVAQEHGSDEPCNSQYTWCHEGGLHNSVWFKIVAKENGMLSIDSYGFDNQMALYDAENIEDLFVKGKYTLLAANDDYHSESENYSATMLPLEGLEPGRTYWLQVDGSAGGDIGEMDIYVYHGVLSVPDNDLEKRIVVYPNPSSDKFNVKLYPNFENKATIEVFDIHGRVIYSKRFDNVSGGLIQNIDLKEHANGIYNFRFTFDNKTIIKKVILNK